MYRPWLCHVSSLVVPRMAPEPNSRPCRRDRHSRLGTRTTLKSRRPACAWEWKGGLTKAAGWRCGSKLFITMQRASQSCAASGLAPQQAELCGKLWRCDCRSTSRPTLVQLELLTDHRAHVLGGGHRLQKGQQLQQLGVARVVEPALDGDAARACGAHSSGRGAQLGDGHQRSAHPLSSWNPKACGELSTMAAWERSRPSTVRSLR